MGLYVGHKCKGCGYSRDVAGGVEAGMKVITITVVCLDCQEIFSAVSPIIKHLPRSRFKGIDPKSDEFVDLYSQGFKPVELKCKYCSLHTIKEWVTGDPCPKCGISMGHDENGLHTLWD